MDIAGFSAFFLLAASVDCCTVVTNALRLCCSPLLRSPRGQEHSWHFIPHGIMFLACCTNGWYPPPSPQGAVTKDSFQTDKTYHLVSTDGKRILRANDTKSTRGWQVRARGSWFDENRRLDLYAQVRKPCLRLSFASESCATLNPTIRRRTASLPLGGYRAEQNDCRWNNCVVTQQLTVTQQQSQPTYACVGRGASSAREGQVACFSFFARDLLRDSAGRVTTPKNKISPATRS